MSPSDAPSKVPASPAKWLAIAGVVVLVGLGALVWWATARASRPAPPVAAPSIQPYRAAWESAMAKAGWRLRIRWDPSSSRSSTPPGCGPSRRRSLPRRSPRFNVCRFEGKIAGSAVSLSDVSLSFPSPGVAMADASVSIDGTAYSMRVTLPLVRDAKGVHSPGATDLVAEGFTVKGARRTQATDAIVGYLNAYVNSAPGLVVQDAAIVAGGLRVTGSAPQRLENPAQPVP